MSPSHKKKSWWFVILVLGFAVFTAILLRDAMSPKVHNLSPRSFKEFKKAGIPQDIQDQLYALTGKRFVEKAELIEAMRQVVTPETFTQYKETLISNIRTQNCGINSQGKSVYALKESRQHPHYNRLTAEPLLPLSVLPPIPTQLLFLPNSAGFLVLGKNGHLVHFSSTYEVLSSLQFPDVYEGDQDQGALGMTLDPEYASNHFVYIAFVTRAKDENVVQRFQWEGDGQKALKSLVDIIRVPKDKTNDYHGIGGIRFNAKGLLVIPIGDPREHSQSLWDYQGKLLGILPNSDPQGGYRPPDFGWWATLKGYLTMGSPIVLASGLRSPWTIAPWKQFVFIGDVGATGPYSHEEINRWSALDQNFGWGECSDPEFHGDFIPPLIDYRRNHSATWLDKPDQTDAGGRSVFLGGVYDFPTPDPYGGILRERLLYGDFYLGFLRGAKLTEAGDVADDVFLLQLSYITAISMNTDGYLYAITATGKEYGMYRILLKPPPL